MGIKRATLLFLGALAVAGLLLVLLSPALVIGGIRAWLWWTARDHDLTIACANIDAPLLRPAVLHNLQVRTHPQAATAVAIDIRRAEVAFNLRELFRRSEVRTLRQLTVEGARIDVRKSAPPETAGTPPNWSLLHDLLADGFKLSQVNVHVENGSTHVDIRKLSLAASELESGPLLIGEVVIASPLVTRSFAKLRGTASWQNSRLTLGALSLTKGVDVDTITADLARLGSRRVDLAVNLDAFGGKLRADITSEERRRRVWNVAGSAAGISLAQMSEILGWREQATGLVRAAKFTFRGDTSALADSTASIWTEINQFTWRERRADIIMFGASLYDERVHVEQLYVKQRSNELTVSGDSSLPGGGALWPLRNFTGYISASIPDVDAFARLLGAERDTYSGNITIEASVRVDDRKLRGGLATAGNLRLTDARFGENLRVTAQLNGNGSTIAIADAHIVQADRTLSLRGEIEVANITDLRVTLSPTVPVVDLTTAAPDACLNSVSLQPLPATETPASAVEQIEIRGGILIEEWKLSLKHAGGLPPPAGDEHLPKTFPLCFGTSGSAAELRLGL